MNDKDYKNNVEQLINKLRLILIDETYFEVVISGLVSTLGQVIIDNYDKKEGIRVAMQVGSQISDSISDAYKSFEKGTGKQEYLAKKCIFSKRT